MVGVYKENALKIITRAAGLGAPGRAAIGGVCNRSTSHCPTALAVGEEKDRTETTGPIVLAN